MRGFMTHGSAPYIPRDCKAERSAFASEWRPYESAHPRLFDGIRHWHLHAGVMPVEQTSHRVRHV
jgi:hypothetical protein